MGRSHNDLVPGTLDLLILQTLKRREMHGYGIAQSIRLVSEDVLQVEEGSLYPALQRLLLKGWVTAKWGKSENNRRARFYRITPDGRRHLARELSDFERVLAAVFRVLRPA
ncbi:MAG: PadR family transcriptional regulator [bacterium]|nr:PadR family transcriptional regulator [bacterium]